MKKTQWSSEQKLQIVMQGVKGRAVSKICNEYQIGRSQYYLWRDQFLQNAGKVFEMPLTFTTPKLFRETNESESTNQSSTNYRSSRRSTSSALINHIIISYFTSKMETSYSTGDLQFLRWKFSLDHLEIVNVIYLRLKSLLRQKCVAQGSLLESSYLKPATWVRKI